MADQVIEMTVEKLEGRDQYNNMSARLQHLENSAQSFLRLWEMFQNIDQNNGVVPGKAGHIVKEILIPNGQRVSLWYTNTLRKDCQILGVNVNRCNFRRFLKKVAREISRAAADFKNTILNELLKNRKHPIIIGGSVCERLKSSRLRIPAPEKIYITSGFWLFA
jgi:hypothetical protein